MENYCRNCHGMIWGLIGVLILINAFVWPQWTGIDGWVAFFGLLLILGGIAKSVTSGCNCHASECCKTDAKHEEKIEAKAEVKAEAPKAKKKK